MWSDPPFDLKDLLAAVGPLARRATWAVSGVGTQELDATGEGGPELERLARTGGRISGAKLADLAARTRQVIWGRFEAYDGKSSAPPCLVMTSVDSTFWDVESADPKILARVSTKFPSAPRQG